MTRSEALDILTQYNACRQCRMDRETQRELRAAAEGEHGA